jgi:hypothetical protein
MQASTPSLRLTERSSMPRCGTHHRSDDQGGARQGSSSLNVLTHHRPVQRLRMCFGSSLHRVGRRSQRRRTSSRRRSRRGPGSARRPKPLLGHLGWPVLHCSSGHFTWHATRLERYGTAKVDTAIYRRASSDRSIHLMKTAHSVMDNPCYPSVAPVLALPRAVASASDTTPLFVRG